MSRISVPIGPFIATYVGLAGQATALSLLPDQRTGGSTLTDEMPSEYVVSQGNNVQTGNHVVTLNLTFISQSDDVKCLAKGIPPGQDPDGTPGQTLYALFLQSGDGDNYYFPSIKTARSLTIPRTKSSPTTIPITFTVENRDASVQLYTSGSLAEVASAMGSQYPL